MGTSYTGPTNPTDYTGEDSYQYIPRHYSEFGSIRHDKTYFKEKAAGVPGALFNTDVIGADFRLVVDNLQNFYTGPYDPNHKLDKVRSGLTVIAFEAIVVFKACQVVGKFINRWAK